MHPSAMALGNLVKGLDPVLEVVEKAVLEQIRAGEDLPAEASALAISIDGAMLGIRKENGAQERRDGPVSAGFREASSGTISVFAGDEEHLRTANFGRLPRPAL